MQRFEISNKDLPFELTGSLKPFHRYGRWDLHLVSAIRLTNKKKKLVVHGVHILLYIRGTHILKVCLRP